MANLTGCSSEARYISKWVTFSASAFIQASAGLSYSFSVYAPTIKDTLGLTQTQIATVGSAVNLGGYFAIISGSMYDNLKGHHRLGPRLVLWLGCMCCFCGYTGLYLMAAGKAPNNFLQLLVFAIAAGNAGTYFDTTTLVTNVRNFPNDRGFVVGVLKSFLGLSSSVYTSVYVAFFEPDAVTFLLMLALLPTVLGLLLSLGLNYVPFVEASEACQHHQQQQRQQQQQQEGSIASHWASTQGRFLSSFLLVGVLALYQMASAVLVGHQKLSRDGKAAMVAGMLVLLGLAAGLPLRCGSWRAEYGHPYIATQESLADEDGEEEAHPPGQPGSPLPVLRREEGRGSSPMLHHAHATAHHRAVGGGGSSSTSSSRPGTAVSISQAAAVAAMHRKSLSGAARSAGSSSSRISSSGASRKDTKQLLVEFEDPAAEAAPLLTPTGAHSPAGVPSDKAGSGGDGSGNGTCVNGGPPGLRQLAMGSLTPSQMLLAPDFWLLFLQFTVACGVCLSYLNNLGQLVVSLGGVSDGQVVFVSLFSVANAGGRLLMGYFPEQFLHARGTPRTLFLTLTAALTAAAALAVAYARLGHLYVLSVLLGVAFGAHWSLLPAITSDLFGLKHFAANYTTLQFAPAMGSYLLATEVTGWLYDRAAAAHGDVHQCVGPDCFRTAFLLLAGLAGLSSVACCLATSRSRRAYAALAMHLKQVDIAEGGHSARGEPDH